MDMWKARYQAGNVVHGAVWGRRLGGFGRPGTRLYLPRKLANPERIYLGAGSVIKRGARLEVVPPTWDTEPTGRIEIGQNVLIEDFCHIGAAADLVIEDDVLIGSYVLIIDHDHTMPEDPSIRPLDGPLDVAPVRINRRAWIGEGAKILKGVTIGSGAIVGAGAVVTRDVAAGAVALGVPARAR